MISRFYTTHTTLVSKKVERISRIEKLKPTVNLERERERERERLEQGTGNKESRERMRVEMLASLGSFPGELLNLWRK